MNFAVVRQQTGEIINRVSIAPSSNWEPPTGCVIVEANYDIGGKFLNGVYTPPDRQIPAIQYVPSSISDRQFFQQLAISGIITKQEALAAVKVGTIPTILATLVAGIPDENQRFAAEMLLSGATVFERHHPLSITIAAAQGMTSAQVDDFFRAAALL